MKHAFLAFALLCLSALPALADGAAATQAWIRALERRGYAEIEVESTWLGRIRITAERGEFEREIILSRSTGEVLRDVTRAEDGAFHHPFEDEEDPGDDDD